MTVLLRCPNCGTTRLTPGTCEACHAAEARYFCTNHKPGFWLDGPTCPDCGARFGDTPRLPASTSALPPRPRTSSPARRRAVSPTPPAYSPPERLPDARPDAVWSRRDSAPPTAPERAARELPTPLWMDLLRNALLARRARTAGLPGGARVARGAGGCLLRAVVLLVCLFLALVAGVLLFGWSMLQGRY